MPLRSLNRPGFENIQGVHFPMTHDETTVRVLVTHEVLQAIDGSPHEQGGHIARFEAYRREFEAIASAKYDGARFHGPLKIAPPDLLNFIAER
jgi:hypothetical protein